MLYLTSANANIGGSRGTCNFRARATTVALPYQHTISAHDALPIMLAWLDIWGQQSHPLLEKSVETIRKR